jgi:hypothetical protein
MTRDDDAVLAAVPTSHARRLLASMRDSHLAGTAAEVASSNVT